MTNATRKFTWTAITPTGWTATSPY